MQVAKRLARGCEATENARGVRGHAAPDTFCNLELNFHVWIYH